MKTLRNIAFLAADTTRSRAYLQMMIKNDICPSFILVYTDNPDKMLKEEQEYHDQERDSYFDEEQPLLYTLKKADLNWKTVQNRDINSEEMSCEIQSFSQEYIIYSGYGGSILHAELFHIGKKYLHVHAGLLPEFRGSTTAYYSILNKGILGATAIFLNEEIDAGDVICEKSFSMPSDAVNIDYVYEPYIRAVTLMKAVNLYLKNGEFRTQKQRQMGEKTYFVIHPVLKHLAVLKIEQNRENNKREQQINEKSDIFSKSRSNREL